MAEASTGVDSAADKLEDLGVPEVLQQKLRFLFKFLGWLNNCEEVCKDTTLSSAIDSHKDLLKEFRHFTEVGCMREEEEVVPPFVLENFEKYESVIDDFFSDLLVPSKSMRCSRDEILELIDFVVETLKADIGFSENQITFLRAKLSFLRNLVDFTVKRRIDNQKLEEFFKYVKSWAHTAATLSFLRLFKPKDEDMEALLSDLQQKIHPCCHVVLTMYSFGFRVPLCRAKFEFIQVVVGLVDFLLEGLTEPLKDYVEMVREGLIVMITFSLDTAEAGDGLLTRVNTVLDEVLFLIISLSVEEKVCLSSLVDEIEKVQVEIRELYVQVPNSSNFSFPSTNALGFMDFVLENLEEMVKRNPNGIAFAKHPVIIIQEKLLSLKPFLNEAMELQKDRKDLENLQNRIMNTVFLAEHVIASCFVAEHPIWYDLLQLSNVIEALKQLLVECEVPLLSNVTEAIKQLVVVSTDTNSSYVPMKQANPSILQDDVVGMEDESEKLIERLTRGTKGLDIVSIVGMPGLGKTTIAKKVYDDENVKAYFHKRAWCCVTQRYNRRELYLDIFSDVSGVDGRKSNFNSIDDDELGANLRQSLMGYRYLIVLDDIWSSEAWDLLKETFPDMNNGSRIMFTSRIHNLGSPAKLDCSPHLLRLLSDEESWDLFQKKLLHGDSSFPDDICKIGKNIVSNCQGLPLAVVLVSGVLTGKKIEFWKQIEERTSFQVAREGCRDVLELSYKHLPDNLKPCFLYFGAFSKDRVVRRRKLIDLWIAEGIIPRSDKKNVYEVAENYLSELIGRSFVMLAERSYSGRIKTCRIHDLLHGLCLEKIAKDNFLQFVEDDDVSQGSLYPKMYYSRRLCINTEWSNFVSTKPAGPFVRTLISAHQKLGKSIPCPSSLFNSFKLLNTLDLEQISIQGSFPVEITLMVHLRYLSIACADGPIPDSIDHLWNLETLLVKGAAAVFLPRTFWKMKRLRHVHASSYFASIMDQEYCELENMVVFSKPFLGSEYETNELFKRLSAGLRKFRCVILSEGGFLLNKFPDFSRLICLEELRIAFTKSSEAFWKNHDQFPALDFPNSLRKLTLEDFRSLPWRAISIIGQLPNLEILKLKDGTFSGERWDTEDCEFLNLKWLELSRLDIQQWNVADDPFPSLQVLVVRACRNLEEIPSSLGNISTLNKIVISFCSEVASSSARKILEEQKDMGNDGLQVIISSLDPEKVEQMVRSLQKFRSTMAAAIQKYRPRQ